MTGGRRAGPAGVVRGGRVAQMVTSFSSKSELALNLSTSGRVITFMGYATRPDVIDVSNSNAPGVIDPTNPVPGAYYRVVATLDERGRFSFTETNAYSGNNGRAAILDDSDGADVLYLAGNAGNGGSPEPGGVIAGAGAQFARPSDLPESAQQPGQPTPLGSFSVTQLGDAADKVGKDTNFRGLAVYGNVVYYTKGSGGNGINTVYFVDTTGKACPDGVGLPEPGAALPTSPAAYDPAVLQSKGVFPYTMCILKGFPTALKSTTSFPFGLWFANPRTLYVADEGNGTATYSAATGQYTAAAAADHGRAAEVGAGRRHLEAGLHAERRPGSRRALPTSARAGDRRAAGNRGRKYLETAVAGLLAQPGHRRRVVQRPAGRSRAGRSAIRSASGPLRSAPSLAWSPRRGRLRPAGPASRPARTAPGPAAGKPAARRCSRPRRCRSRPGHRRR